MAYYKQYVELFGIKIQSSPIFKDQLSHISQQMSFPAYPTLPETTFIATHKPPA